jgi:DNA polymerase-3 subunit gamma/tau
MVYQVLARKWRPQDFAGVVGQAPIVAALRHALTEGRIAQAYLFSGIRGVGKTSVARVLAKALNCERGPAADPCNECSSCREITAGADLDVLEVDAATYSKVEQVRELTESLRYGPARDRYKVVVLDEIHRLSRQAFDALLKIVEEPPPRLVFIFATTEAEDVPATILSRCQEFRFRRVPAAALSAHLREIAEAEGIRVGESSLRLIARAAEGSVRDGVALLDQLANFGAGAISDEDARQLAGGVDAGLFNRLLHAILDGDGALVARALAEVEVEGWDPRHIFTQFLGYCRDALHVALGGGSEHLELPGEDAAALAAVAKGAGYENLLRVLHHLLGSEATVRRSELGELALEIALLKAAELPKLIRIEELLGGRPISPAPATAPLAPAAGLATSLSEAPRPDPPAPRSPEPSRPPRPRPPARAQAPAPVEAAPAGQGSGHGAEVESFLAEVSARKPSLAAHLAEAEALRFEGGTLRIATPAGDPLIPDALRRAGNRQALENAVRAVWGDDAGWSLAETVDVDRRSVGTDEAGAAPAAMAAENHPTVQRLLDLFGGEVEAAEKASDGAPELLDEPGEDATR